MKKAVKHGDDCYDGCKTHPKQHGARWLTSHSASITLAGFLRRISYGGSWGQGKRPSFSEFKIKKPHSDHTTHWLDFGLKTRYPSKMFFKRKLSLYVLKGPCFNLVCLEDFDELSSLHSCFFLSSFIFNKKPNKHISRYQLIFKYISRAPGH